MRMYKVKLLDYRSLRGPEFEVGPFTVLFGKNNAGKTNLLEAIYGVLAPHDMPDEGLPARGLRGRKYLGPPMGAVYVALEPGLAFDDAVLALVPDRAEVGLVQFREGPFDDVPIIQFRDLPPGHVCFASTLDNESNRNGGEPELWFVDVADFFDNTDAFGLLFDPVTDEFLEIGEQTRLITRWPRPRPLFLGWEFDKVDRWVTSAIAELTIVRERWGWEEVVAEGHTAFGRDTGGWLEPVGEGENAGAWRVRPLVGDRLDQLAKLATDLLPDFIDGSIRVEFHVPTDWDDAPKVRVSFQERGESERHSLEDFGRGASRWMAIAVQVALRLMEEDQQITKLGVTGARNFSAHVLLVDEPEAHLHPSAVASVVRWCQRMVDYGFTVIAASHHEEFLRASGDDVTFVKVSREVTPWNAEEPRETRTQSRTKARTLPITATSTLQEMAEELGMHPAAALSLYRAVLFVEGPLDEAVLDEYAGPAFDAAGVTIIPIHGTKNLEGLIDGEFTTRLGIKNG